MFCLANVTLLELRVVSPLSNQCNAWVSTQSVLVPQSQNVILHVLVIFLNLLQNWETWPLEFLED